MGKIGPDWRQHGRKKEGIEHKESSDGSQFERITGRKKTRSRGHTKEKRPSEY